MFDDTIKKLREWFAVREREPHYRRIFFGGELDFASPDDSEISPSSIIMKEDTYVELGHPSAGSCSLCAATLDDSVVAHGTLTVFGPDIAESRGKILPFAQLVVVSCREDAGETALLVDRIVHSASQMKGYMLRSVPNRIWARVSHEAAHSGFSLERLGMRLYGALMKQCSGVTGVAIFFVTSSKEDVAELGALVQPARDTLAKIQTYTRLPDGSYECSTGLDCTECPEKPVCDNIREVITIRKGDRIIKFERNTD